MSRSYKLISFGLAMICMISILALTVVAEPSTAPSVSPSTNSQSQVQPTTEEPTEEPSRTKEPVSEPETTQKKTTKTTRATERTEYRTSSDENTTGVIGGQDGVDRTKETKSTKKITTTTVPSKNITDYGKAAQSKLIIPIILIVLSGGGLIVVNVIAYRNRHKNDAKNAAKPGGNRPADGSDQIYSHSKGNLAPRSDKKGQDRTKPPKQ